MVALMFTGDQGVRGWFPWATALWGLVNLISIVAILRWKKWGVVVLIAAACIMIPINLVAGIGFAVSLAGLVSAAIVYALLQLRVDGQKAWEHLD